MVVESSRAFACGETVAITRIAESTFAFQPSPTSSTLICAEAQSGANRSAIKNRFMQSYTKVSQTDKYL